MHTTHNVHDMHCSTHFYTAICLCIVALVSLCRIVKSLLSVCLPYVHASVMISKHLSLSFLLLFLGIPFLFVFSLLLVCLYSLVPVHNMSVYTSVHLHVNFCTCIGFTVAILQQLPSRNPKLTKQVFSTLAMILKFVGVIINYYSLQITADFAVWLSNLTTKRTIGFLVCVMFSLVSALGIVLPLILVMSVVRYHHIYFLKKYKGLYNFGGNDQQSGIIVS